MNGEARPYENSTTDIANTATRLFFCTRHVLTTYFGSSLSVGLRLAKTTEIRAKEGLCLSAIAFRLALRPPAIAFKLVA